MEPLTHYTIAIIYQQKAPPEPTEHGTSHEQTARWLRLSRRLITRIGQTVANATTDRQAQSASNPLIECYREQE
jgi:hypothetical protein